MMLKALNTFKKILAGFFLLLVLQTPLAATQGQSARAQEPSPVQSPTRGGAQKSSSRAAAGRSLRPLWPGSRWTERDRARSVRRGLQFIYRTALEKENFSQYGSDYLWCFYSLSEAFSDREAKALARRMGRERARRWRLLHPHLPPYADPGTIADYAFGSDAADSLGVRDERLKEEIRRAAPRYSARAYLLFDPLKEPPPEDVPDQCDSCHAYNVRGTTACAVCKRPLRMRTRYDVWYDALITAYSGEHYGVVLGAKYRDVLAWLPTLRPYIVNRNELTDEFFDTVYAITHVVYTLNDYGLYRINPRLLSHEFEFLKANMMVAVRMNDADMLGEFMDSLRALGMETEDALMRSGMEHLLARQNSDGSWGNTREKDIYLRYHPTWNAVAALSEYAWRGEGLSHPELKPLLEQWAEKSRSPLGLLTFHHD